MQEVNSLLIIRLLPWLCHNIFLDQDHKSDIVIIMCPNDAGHDLDIESFLYTLDSPLNDE